MKSILLIIVTLLLNCQTSFAAEKLTKKPAQKNDVIITKIKSNFIDIRRENEEVYLYGNVIVERQDLSVLADKMIVYYYENTKENPKKKIIHKDEDEFGNEAEDGMEDDVKDEKNGKKDKKVDKKTDQSQVIKKIEAKDNVKIFNDEFVATGKSGVYDPKENNFILEEDVVLNKGTSVARGQKFIYNLNTKKGNLVGGKDTPNKQDAPQKWQNPEESDNQSDDRVIMIINDSDVKTPKK